MSLPPDRLFQLNLPVIEGVIRWVASQHRLNPDEREEFAGDVRLKLIDNDFEVLRRFEHRSALKTFLVTVIQRMFLDFRDKKWGKWRPSAEARRAGKIALRLERLVYRDGHSFNEAVNTLQTNEQVPLSRDELFALFQRLPPRMPRRFVSDRTLEGVEAPADHADDGLLAQEGADVRRRVREVIGRTVQALPTQDRLIIKLAYVDRVSIADIARLLSLDQKPLYRRVARLRQDLRRALEAAGITSADILDDLPDEAEGDEPSSTA